MIFWWTTLALAGPPSVVTFGNGPVVAEVEDVRAGGDRVWEMVMADCLRESTSAGWTVVDRMGPVWPGPAQVSEVRALHPHTVLALGATGPWDATRASALRELIAGLRAGGGPQVLVVTPVAPLRSSTAEQAKVDALATAWNVGIAGLVAGADGVQRVDLWTTWPRAEAERAALTGADGRLTDLGHTRVGTALCEALVSPQITTKGEDR